jgi:arginyl-tRNA synthetase
MATISSQLDAAFRAAIIAAFGVNADPLIAQSQNEKFGDYQSNAAMGLVKILSEKTGTKSNPRAIAEQIKGKLEMGEMGEEVSIAGPGFINVKLSAAWVTKMLRAVAEDARLGIEKANEPRTVVVDYSGPNIAKEMHVGHLRSTIIGDALARVLDFLGHKVKRQNHIGDWGTQFGMLIQYLDELNDTTGSLTGLVLSDLENFYRLAKKRFDSDADFADRARRAVVQLQSGDSKALDRWDEICQHSRNHYQEVYRLLGVGLTPHDERGESFYRGRLAGVVADLKSAGIAVESEGAVVVFVEGYETPLMIRKSDGGYLYGTTDLAAIQYRVTELGAARIIYTHDSRQAQHFSQIFAVARKAGWANGVSLEFAPFGTMLGEDGRPFKTRSGDIVKLKDLLIEAEERALIVVAKKNPHLSQTAWEGIAHDVGIGGIKYADLSKDRLSDYIFSFDKMLALDGNTAPYLQYAHARVRSIFRRAVEQGAKPGELKLESPFELALAKHLLRLADVVALVARELKPHHLCTYLYELATKFSGFYENCPVLKSEEAVRASRLALCDVTGRTIALGLDLLGIEHPEEM